MNAPRVDLAQLLVKATTFARHWRDQDGCNAQVLDELADAIEGYVANGRRMQGERPDLVVIDDPMRGEVPASCDAHRLDEVCPDCAPMHHAAMNAGRVHVRGATDDEQRVTERELRAAQRAWRTPGDFHWITRLPDGRALFLMPWSRAGAQLSIGALGEMTFTNTWNFHPGFTDAAWRAVLGWDGIGEPEGWTRHPASSRVRPDGTPSSEAVER